MASCFLQKRNLHDTYIYFTIFFFIRNIFLQCWSKNMLRIPYFPLVFEN